MNKLYKQTSTLLTALTMMVLGFVLSGCGGSSPGGVSSEVVSGTAAVGDALSGQVSLKDSSSPAKEKTTVIASDGTFAIDVTGMKAPYVLRASGTAAGINYKLHSFAEGRGTANINPLSDAIVTCAAEENDPSYVYEKSDHDRNQRIKNNLAKSVTVFLTKLQPLLKQYASEYTNPITSKYIVNHLDMDEMFDKVKIRVKDGIITIVNRKTEAVIFTGSLSELCHRQFQFLPYQLVLQPLVAQVR
jgi:hypothetical protein